MCLFFGSKQLIHERHHVAILASHRYHEYTLGWNETLKNFKCIGICCCIMNLTVNAGRVLSCIYHIGLVFGSCKRPLALKDLSDNRTKLSAMDLILEFNSIMKISYHPTTYISFRVEKFININKRKTNVVYGFEEISSVHSKIHYVFFYILIMNFNGAKKFCLLSHHLSFR